MSVMKKAVRYVAFLLVVVGSGCEREIPVLDGQPIAGYEIQGKVTDRLGNPIPNVAVFLDYTVSPVSIDTSVTRQYFLGDSTGSMWAVVTDAANRIVVVLSNPTRVSGWYQAIWNGNDSTGHTAPSGIYTIQYFNGGRIVFSYEQLVTSGQVALTDAYGRYTIPALNLPFDSTSVPYFSTTDSSYVGNFQISTDVVLTYQYGPRLRQVELTVNYGTVTFADVTFD